MKKTGLSRRDFFLGMTACAAASALHAGCVTRVNRARVTPRKRSPNETVNVGLIGFGEKGLLHFGNFNNLPNVKVVSVADPDLKQMERIPGHVETRQDFRVLLDRKDLDAVVIATPDHWHCLAAIWAMQAGKHVYVEKPVSRCIWEGRKMVEAARTYRRIVQAGTQHRSCPGVQECARDIQSGMYGKVLWVHCSKLEGRAPIGKVSGPQAPPPSLDYNLWAGPAPKTPIMRRRFHYDWHWQWNWGTGEMGNWGVHYLDDLRHLLGWDDVPGNVLAAGNRWWDDDGETPNIHLALMEHRGVSVVVDIRNMPDPSLGAAGKEGAVYLASRSGNYIMCENGYVRIARGGGKGFDASGRVIKQYRGDGGSGHAANFIDAIRAGSKETLNAEIEVGHLSTVMAHLANISYRLGGTMPIEELRETTGHSQDAQNTLASILRQLDANGVDLKSKPFWVGPRLTYDNVEEAFTGRHAAEANALVRLACRASFEVPERP